MNPSDEYFSTMEELGLSPSQARVYLALVKSKNLTASGIHNACGVARPDVYRVLGELEKAGLVEKIISRPKNFHAISIEECLSTLLQRRITKTLTLQKKALKLTQTLGGKTGSEEPCEKFGFILIEGRDAVYAKAERMIKSAQQSIWFLGFTRRMLAWLSNSLPSMEKALARNVEVKMIMPKPQGDLWEAAKIRKTPKFRLKTDFGTS